MCFFKKKKKVKVRPGNIKRFLEDLKQRFSRMPEAGYDVCSCFGDVATTLALEAM